MAQFCKCPDEGCLISPAMKMTPQIEAAVQFIVLLAPMLGCMITVLEHMLLDLGAEPNERSVFLAKMVACTLGWLHSLCFRLEWLSVQTARRSLRSR